MKDDFHRQMAIKVIASIRNLGSVVELSQEKMSASERAAIVIPIGNAMDILQTELLAELVRRDATLIDLVHRSIPLGGLPKPIDDEI